MKIPIILLAYCWLMFGALCLTTTTPQPSTKQLQNTTPLPTSLTSLDYEEVGVEELLKD